MSLIRTAYNQITRYGFQDSAFLLKSNSAYDKNTMEYTGTDTQIGMYAYVHGYPASRVNNTTVLAEDRRILARIDSNFDGQVSKGDKVKVDGNQLSVIRSEFFVVSGNKAYVEIQARG